MGLWAAIVKPVFVVVGGSVCVVSCSFGMGLLFDQFPELQKQLQKQPSGDSKNPQALQWLASSNQSGALQQPLDFGAEDLWTSDDLAQFLSLGAAFGFVGCGLYARAVRNRVALEFQHRRETLLNEVQVYLQTLEQQHQQDMRRVRAEVAAFDGHIHFPPPLPAAQPDGDEDAPQWAMCPISMCPMTEPVITPAGVTYDRHSILRWIEMHNDDPSTRQPITVKHVYPNLALRDQIENWIVNCSNRRNVHL